MPKLALSLAAFLIGLALVLAWGFNVFGDWATDIIAGLLLTGGAWGMIDACLSGLDTQAQNADRDL